jgi:hypothetical protein
MSSTYSMLSRPYYNSSDQCYQKVISVSPAPKGNLATICKRVTFEKLSPFDEPACGEKIEKCGYLLINPENKCEYATLDDLASIFTWLTMNGYIVDTSITNMLSNSDVKMKNPLICFVTG